MAQNMVRNALLAMNPECKSSDKRQNPAFPVHIATFYVRFMRSFEKTFSCQFPVNTAICPSSGNLRAWEDL
jgi:hypothetical protein